MTTATKELHEITILDETGDTKLIWDPDDEAQVENARATFDKFKKKKYLIYRTDRKGEKAEVMHTFDPEAEKMIISPPVVGG